MKNLPRVAICDTNKLETANFFNLIGIGILLVVTSLWYLFLLYERAGFYVFEYIQYFDKTFEISCCAGLILSYKFCWCVSFIVFYADEVPLCLNENEDDPVFDELYPYLVSILVIEVFPLIVTPIICCVGIFSICLLLSMGELPY